MIRQAPLDLFMAGRAYPWRMGIRVKQERPEQLDDATRAAIGKRFRSELKRAKVSGAELGRDVGVTRAAVNHWLTGKTQPEVAQLWRMLHRHNDISVDYILTGRVKDDPEIVALARRLAAMPDHQRAALAALFSAAAPDGAVLAAFGKPPK